MSVFTHHTKEDECVFEIFCACRIRDIHEKNTFKSLALIVMFM